MKGEAELGDSNVGRDPRLAGWPTSKLGWTAMWAFVTSVVLVVLNTLVVMPITESRAGLNTVQAVFNAVVGACVLVAGITGLTALIRNRERSWAVILPVLIVLAVLGIEVVELISG